MPWSVADWIVGLTLLSEFRVDLEGNVQKYIHSKELDKYGHFNIYYIIYFLFL